MRLGRGWSQEQLAEASGLSVRTIQRIENGQAPGLASAAALARVFDVGVDQLGASDDVAVLVQAEGAVTLEVPVATSFDDVEENASGSINRKSVAPDPPYAPGGSQSVGPRFPNLPVPHPGAHLGDGEVAMFGRGRSRPGRGGRQLLVGFSIGVRVGHSVDSSGANAPTSAVPPRRLPSM